MNYFAHGRNYLASPSLMAGTAVPDWLSVVNRRVRARSRLAVPWTDASDSVLAGVARGVVIHHHDDAWFHQTRAFAELSLEFTVGVRDLLADDLGFRPSFLGHILVEILLDAALIEQNQAQLDAYYKVLQQLDPDRIAEAVHRISTGRAENLSMMIELFVRERFLYDYLDDKRLLSRLNRVMLRVKLPELPPSMHTFLAAARQPVRDRVEELLDGEKATEFEENQP